MTTDHRETKQTSSQQPYQTLGAARQPTTPTLKTGGVARSPTEGEKDRGSPQGHHEEHVAAAENKKGDHPGPALNSRGPVASGGDATEDRLLNREAEAEAEGSPSARMRNALRRREKGGRR